MTIINPLTANLFIPVATTVPTPEERQTQLRVDQVVHATVAEGGLDKVVLEMGHRKFPAQTSLPLTTGQKLMLQVQEVAPQLQLRVVDQGMEGRLRQALHFLGPVWDWAPALASILVNTKALRAPLSKEAREVFTAFLGLLQSDLEDVDGRLLAGFSRRMGLSLEAELFQELPLEESLKKALMETLGKLDESREDVGDHLRQMLHELEMFQMCRARMSQEGYYFIPLTLPGLEQAFVLADRKPQRETAEGERPFSLNIFMKLNGLGSMKVDLLYEQGALWARFSCDSAEKMEFLESFEEELQQSLTSVQLREAVFTTGAEDPGKVLVQRMVSKQDHVFDERV